MSYLPGVQGFLYVPLTATRDGDNQIIAGTAGKSIVVLGYALNVNAAGVVKFQDSAGTPVVHAEFEFVDGGGATYAGGLACPAFALAEGVDLEINCAAGVDATGHLTYALVS